MIFFQGARATIGPGPPEYQGFTITLCYGTFN